MGKIKILSLQYRQKELTRLLKDSKELGFSITLITKYKEQLARVECELKEHKNKVGIDLTKEPEVKEKVVVPNFPKEYEDTPTDTTNYIKHTCIMCGDLTIEHPKLENDKDKHELLAQEIYNIYKKHNTPCNACKIEFIFLNGLYDVMRKSKSQTRLDNTKEKEEEIEEKPLSLKV